MPKQKTVSQMDNVEFVTHMMNYSRHGALAQIFILDALEKWSAIIAKADPAELDTPMLNGAAWVSVAKEIQDKLAKRFA